MIDYTHLELRVDPDQPLPLRARPGLVVVALACVGVVGLVLWLVTR